MANRQVWSLGAVLVGATLLAVARPGPAGAHEPRTQGGLRFVVGWAEEPAYAGYMNSVEVTLTDAGSGARVTDLGGSLNVEVIKGSERVTLALEPAPGTPGDYRAALLPTRPGTYTFRLTGTVRGQAVDESFTSSEDTFDDVKDAADIQFPAKDPSTGQLATRIEREFPRLDTRSEDLEASIDATRTVATVAVAVAVVSLVVAVAAMAARRRGGAAHPRPRADESSRGPEQARSLSR